MQPPEALLSSAILHLKNLVGYASVSNVSNIPVIEYIEAQLDAHGFSHQRAPSPEGDKTNLLARIGPEVAGGIVLSGHSDVVPVVGQPWDTPPFELTEKNGQLYGRGTADMKSFIAVCLAMLPHWAALKLRRPFWLAISYDEEVGCLGVPHLLAHMKGRVPSPDFVIIGEPTMMRVVTAHKGVFSFETLVEGLEWHSSQPAQGVNAVHVGCELVHGLVQLARQVESSAMRDPRFNPPHSTIHVGTIRGGTARNIIPRECRFHWEIRPLPGEDHTPWLAQFEAHCALLRERMRSVYAAADIRTRPISRMAGVSLPSHATEFRRCVMHSARTNEELAVSFGTEAGVFNDNGIPAIVCGPGDIDQAHKPNEHIAVAQLAECIGFMLRLPSDAGMIES